MKNSFKLLILGMLAVFVCTITTCTVAQAQETYNVTSVKASHILVDSKQEADALKVRIDNGENFETLAKKYSKCPSGAEGGDLGYFQKGQMVKEFENSAFKLPIGQVSDPIKTQFGWHLIKVYDKK